MPSVRNDTVKSNSLDKHVLIGCPWQNGRYANARYGVRPPPIASDTVMFHPSLLNAYWPEEHAAGSQPPPPPLEPPPAHTKLHSVEPKVHFEQKSSLPMNLWKLPSHFPVSAGHLSRHALNDPPAHFSLLPHCSCVPMTTSLQLVNNECSGPSTRSPSVFIAPYQNHRSTVGPAAISEGRCNVSLPKVLSRQ